jgi:chloride channel protein, CIC family
VMRTNLVAFPATNALGEIGELIRPGHGARGQLLYPVVDDSKRLIGVLSRNHISKLLSNPSGTTLAQPVAEFALQTPTVAYPNEPLRAVVYRMVETGLTRFPVVDPDDERKLLGMVALNDLLQARSRNLTEERAREQVLRLRLPLRGESKQAINA